MNSILKISCFLCLICSRLRSPSFHPRPDQLISTYGYRRAAKYRRATVSPFARGKTNWYNGYRRRRWTVVRPRAIKSKNRTLSPQGIEGWWRHYFSLSLCLSDIMSMGLPGGQKNNGTQTLCYEMAENEDRFWKLHNFYLLALTFHNWEFENKILVSSFSK